MSLTLDRLEAKGWVRRSFDPVDRRRVIVELTPAGLRLATRVNKALHEWEADLDIDRDLAEVAGVLDDGAERPLEADVLTAEGQPPIEQPAGALQR